MNWDCGNPNFDPDAERERIEQHLILKGFDPQDDVKRQIGITETLICFLLFRTRMWNQKGIAFT